MQFAVVSLFPEIFQNYFNYGVVGRAVQNKLVMIDYYNPRDYSDCKHRTVDDKPYGGGAGMVLKPEPIGKAIEAAKNKLILNSQNPLKVIYLTPQGKLLNQNILKSFVDNNQSLVLLTGRYEGLDERVINKYVDEEYSIGDYVLSGGELAALVILDGLIRLMPGALGDQDSALNESFSDNLFGLLEYPQYTRPVNYCGDEVPAVLQSGDHQRIRRWREKQVIGRTWLRRPDLLKCVSLTADQKHLLAEFQADSNL